MTGAELFDRFVGNGITTNQIAALNVPLIAAQIKELRADEPDTIEMTDYEIAEAIMEYAQNA